jgi:hypothetical protein
MEAQGRDVVVWPLKAQGYHSLFGGQRLILGEVSYILQSCVLLVPEDVFLSERAD